MNGVWYDLPAFYAKKLNLETVKAGLTKLDGVSQVEIEVARTYGSTKYAVEKKVPLGKIELTIE